MIGKSVFLMSVIDVLIVFAAIYLVAVLYRNYRATRKLGLTSGINFILLGLIAIALFYFTDLLIMHVLPSFSSGDYAMAVMTDLHLTWSWVNTLFAIGAITIGLSYVLQRVVPKAAFALEDLEQRVDERTAERKAAERALREGEEQIRAIINSVSVAISVKDVEGRLLFVNKAYERIYGVTDDAARGKTPSEALTESAAATERRLTHDRKVTETRIADTREEKIPLPDGSFVDTFIAKTPMLNSHGDVIGVCSAITDLTEIKRVEQALRESEKRYRHMFQAAPVSLWEEDWSAAKVLIDELHVRGAKDFHRYFDQHPEFVEQVTGAIQSLSVNQATLDIYRASNEEAFLAEIARRIEDDRFSERLAALAAGVERVVSEGKDRHFDGAVFDARTSIEIPQANRDDWSRVYTSVEDITERKHAEDELHKSEQELQEKSTLLQTTLSTIVEGFSVFDKDLRLVAWTPNYEKLIYFPSEMIKVGAPYEDFIRYNAEHGEYGPGDPEEQVATRMEHVRSGHRGRLEWHRTDGSILAYESYPMPGGGLSTTARDITERKHLEAKTRQQEMQLIQANKMTALGTMVSGVAHEINNPNNMILMNAQVLAEAWRDASNVLDRHDREHKGFMLGGLPYAEMREHVPSLIGDVHDAAQRIRKITDNLRDFSRPQRKTVQSDFSINKAVERALALLEHTIKQTAARFEVNLAEGLPALKGDAHKIEQAVINLVMNALEALPDQGGAVKVATHLNQAENCVEFRVQDEGIGIPPEHLQRVFEPFFTTKQDSGGTGLGLAITYTLVKELDGTLSFESAPGQGTLARVRLPLHAELKQRRSKALPATG